LIESPKLGPPQSGLGLPEESGSRGGMKLDFAATMILIVIIMKPYGSVE
jgi:hypothetical protein